MTGVLRPGNVQFCDSAGKPLAGGKVFVYVLNTTTLAAVFQNTQLTVPSNTNADGSVPLDGNGCALMFGNGQFTLAVFDYLGNPVGAGSGPSMA